MAEEFEFDVEAYHKRMETYCDNLQSGSSWIPSWDTAEELREIWRESWKPKSSSAQTTQTVHDVPHKFIAAKRAYGYREFCGFQLDPNDGHPCDAYSTHPIHKGFE